jgi:hypothetical protein
MAFFIHERRAFQAFTERIPVRPVTAEKNSNPESKFTFWDSKQLQLAIPSPGQARTKKVFLFLLSENLKIRVIKLIDCSASEQT